MSAKRRKTINLLVGISLICSFDPALSADHSLAEGSNLADSNSLSCVKEMIRSGKTQQAIVQLDKLLSLNPDCASAHYYRGKILASKGQTAQAIESFQTAALLAENEKEIAASVQKEINLLQAKPRVGNGGASKKAIPREATTNKGRFFELSAAQNRRTVQVSDRLAKQLRGQVGDLYHLASAGSVIPGQIDEYPDDQRTSPPLPITVSSSPGRGSSGVFEINPKPPVPIFRGRPIRKLSELKTSYQEVQEELEIPAVKLSAVEKQKLSNHDIVFIIDHSGSMQTRDCPGRLSRWQWIQAEVSQMGDETKQALPRGVNAVFFDQNAEEFKKASAQELFRLMNVFTPSGGTNTGLAFRTQSNNIRSSLAANHPVVVIAITDGCPSNGLDLTQAIEELATIASRQKAKLKIAFLQIGTNANGLQTLNSLHELLDGQKTKINVHAFNEVNAKGLTRTILDEL